MRRVCLSLMALILLSGCSAIVHKKISKDPFVRVEGLQFIKDDKPYYFVGTNLWYGANLAYTPAGRERLKRELDLMRAVGISNIRVLGASEGPGQHNSVRPQFKPDQNSINEKMLEGLDFLLDEMRKRDMTAVIYLHNFWVWSGGMSQYVSWFTGEPVPNPFIEGNTWTQFQNFSARFYAHKAANKLFRDYITTLITRRNTINGRLYLEDPTIMSWQLSNEPRPVTGNDDDPKMANFHHWIETTAAFIDSLDGNHLISTGNEGLMGCGRSENCYLTGHKFDSIDYMTMHIWIYNWGWLKPQNMAATYPTSEKNAVDYLKKHSQYARDLNKPITLEEFGAPRDSMHFSPAAPTTYRDRYFKVMFDEIYKDAAGGGPIAGSNFWAWGGEGRAKDPSEAVWRDGDDLVGDPPQEPQGLNSIFSSDKTTLAVITEHGKAMNALCKKEKAAGSRAKASDGF